MSKKDDLNLKGPDALQVQASKGLDFALKNKAAIIAGVVVALSVALIVIGVSYFQDSAAEDRREELAKIDMIYEKEQTAFAEKRSAIEKKLDAQKLLVEENKEAAQPELVAKYEAELAAFGDEPDHSASLAAYQKFYEDYKAEPVGWVAGLRVAHAKAEAKDLAAAAAIVKPIFEQSSGHDILHHQSGIILISLLEDQSQFDEAMQVADTLLSDAGAELKPQYLLIKARNLYLAKKAEEARTVLKSIVDEHGTSQEATKAKSMLALLNS